DHLPAVRRDMKEDSAARSDSHLRSVASVLQLFVALQQRFVDGIALFHSTGKKRLGHAVQAKIERIEQNQPGLFQQTCKKLAESASVGFLGLITFSQNCRQLSAAITAEHLRCGLAQCINSWTKRHTPHRCCMPPACGQFESDKFAVMEK